MYSDSFFLDECFSARKDKNIVLPSLTLVTLKRAWNQGHLFYENLPCESQTLRTYTFVSCNCFV